MERRTVSAIAGFVFLWVLLGLLLIPYAGIQTDEPFFAVPIYEPPLPNYCVSLFHHLIPLMIFPYTGTLKSLLYWPILKSFGPGPYSLRIPVVLIGAATIALFLWLSERMAGARAAFLAFALLATDPSFLLTDTFDWGPVALEHLLLVTGCLLITFRRPGLGFFCFGLALWNKATFVWALAGLAAGVMTAYLPELRRAVADRRLVLRCAAGLAAGALPLIVYNFHSPNATLRSNVHLSTEDFQVKLVSLKRTVEGSALFGFVAAPESEEMPKTLRSLQSRTSSSIRHHLGAHHSSLLLYALIFAVLGAPIWWRSPGRRAALFAIAFSLVAFLIMALTRYTGFPHHAVLLWPMPQLLVGIAVAALRPKWLVVAIGTFLVAANLLVVNQYLFQLERNGAYGFFTDALYPLSDSISDAAGDTIYLVDWGVWGNLNFLHEGRLKLQPAWPIPSRGATEIENMLSDPRGLFLDHVPAREYYQGSDDRLNAVAEASGYARHTVRTIQDSNGRPVFALFRFDKKVPEGH